MQLQAELRDLVLEKEDLLARDSAKTDRIKEIKAEANQAKIMAAEKISELKCAISDKDKELERLRHRVTECESLLDIKDEQVEALETRLEKLAEKSADDNYYAELIEARVQYQALHTKARHFEARLEKSADRVIQLELQVDKVEEANRQLEQEKLLNQSEYEMLTLEVENFSKDIERLQHEKSKIDNMLKQKELRCEELEYQLKTSKSNTENPGSPGSTTFRPNNDSLPNRVIQDSAPMQAAINKLTAKMYEFLQAKQDGQVRRDYEDISDEVTISKLYKGISL